MASRIAYVVTEDWYFTQHRLPMARAARDVGFEVHVLARLTDGASDIVREGFVPHALSWRRRSMSPLAGAAAVAEVRSTLNRIRPVIVHNVALKPAVIGSLACLGLPGVRVVNSVTGLGSAFLRRSPAGSALRAVLKLSFALLFNRKRTCVLVQNPDDRAAMLAAGVRPDGIVLIPGSGVDTDVLQPLPEPPPPIRIAFVGRMLEDKGVRTLIEAHRRLRERHMPIELVLAGVPDPENPTSIPLDELEAWAQTPGVAWLGYVRDIKSVWASSHIAVLPSRREGLPKSLLEAAATARPLIASDAPGCREVVRHGETGLLVPVDQPEPLAEAIARLAADADLRRRMGAAARALTVAKFSSGDIGRQTVGLYKSLLADP
ncbi:MAG TPA: glycosyltransferase family 4 protein [Hyphomicrobiaceae bacterium]|nr:glycosyltransferase family 4 protein [Hyphomicrobiaceae bacterium]